MTQDERNSGDGDASKNRRGRAGLGSSGFGRLIIILARRKRLIEKLGILSIALTAAQYFFTYGDRVEERRVKDWDQLRVVQVALADTSIWKGNLGAAPALERLTKDCWIQQWLFWPLTYFRQDCSELKSLKLEGADIAAVKLRAAVVAAGSFRCSNLNVVDFRKADVTRTFFGAASLRGADFRGAQFSTGYRGGAHVNPLYLADISGAKFDDSTDIPPEKLECACADRNEQIRVDGNKFKNVKIRECQPLNVCKDGLINKDRVAEVVKIYGLPEHCLKGIE